MSTKSTHPVNVTYLVVGLVFLGIAGSWALGEAGIVETGGARWVLPMTLVVAGLVGLCASVTKGLRRAPRDDEPEDETTELPPRF